MKKIIVLLLALIMVLACVACGSKGSKPSDTTTDTSVAPPATTDPVVTEDPAYADPKIEKEDFGGTTVTFLVRSDGTYKSIAIFEDSSNNVDSAVFWRNFDLQEKYNIVIDCIELANDQVAAEAKKQINSDELAFDVLDTAPQFQFSLAVDGLLYDMADVPIIDSTKSYWLNKFNEETSVYGRNYFLASYANLWALDSAGVVFFNTQLAEDLELGNLYQLVKDNEWTFDVMKQMSQLAYEDDGDSTWDLGDRFGSVSTMACVETMYVGIGGTILVPDGDEDLKITYTSEDNIDRLTKIIDFWADESSVLTARYGDYMPDSNQSILVHLMLGGRALFAQEQLYQLSKFADSQYVIGMLPLPMYDEDQDGYRSATHFGQASTSSIPYILSSDRLRLVGSVLEDMAYTGYRDIRPQYYDTNLKLRRAQDEDSRDVLDIIFSNTVVDLGTCLSHVGFSPNGIMRELVRDSNTAVSSRYGEVASTYESKLQDFITKITSH